VERKCRDKSWGKAALNRKYPLHLCFSRSDNTSVSRSEKCFPRNFCKCYFCIGCNASVNSALSICKWERTLKDSRRANHTLGWNILSSFMIDLKKASPWISVHPRWELIARRRHCLLPIYRSIGKARHESERASFMLWKVSSNQELLKVVRNKERASLRSYEVTRSRWSCVNPRTRLCRELV